MFQLKLKVKCKTIYSHALLRIHVIGGQKLVRIDVVQLTCEIQPSEAKVLSGCNHVIITQKNFGIVK